MPCGCYFRKISGRASLAILSVIVSGVKNPSYCSRQRQVPFRCCSGDDWFRSLERSLLGRDIEVEGILKVLLQRVTKAFVTVGDEVVGQIGRGLVVFIGVAQEDTQRDADYLADKIVNLRIFADEASKFNLSALEIRGELLIVSQFTLLADARKGRRPSFNEAAPPEQAESLFNLFVARVRDTGLKIEMGRFQQHMLVEIHNDGPVTIMLDSKQKFA